MLTFARGRELPWQHQHHAPKLQIKACNVRPSTFNQPQRRTPIAWCAPTNQHPISLAALLRVATNSLHDSPTSYRLQLSQLLHRTRLAEQRRLVSSASAQLSPHHPDSCSLLIITFLSNSLNLTSAIRTPSPNEHLITPPSTR